MDRFRRTSSPMGHGRALVISGERDRNSGKKGLSLGRAAESFQNRLLASFRGVKKVGSGEGLAQGGRFVAPDRHELRGKKPLY